MTEKENLIHYINNPTHITTESVNRPRIVNWNCPYSAIEEIFTRDEIDSMSEEMVKALVMLADGMIAALYGHGDLVKVIKFDNIFLPMRDDKEINGFNFGRFMRHLNAVPYKYIPDEGFSNE